MKHSFLMGLAVLTAVVSSHARAEWGNGVNRLVTQARELDLAVRRARMAYPVQQATYRFSYDADRLSDCFSRPPQWGGCRPVHDQVRRSFAIVERYLYNVNFSNPVVYREYVQAKNALNALNVGPIPGPGPGPHAESFVCVAVDNGWEEHGGGHRAYGRNLNQAQRQALLNCQQSHGSCRIQRCDRVN